MLRKPQQKEGGAIGPVTPLLQMSGIPLICHLGKLPLYPVLNKTLPKWLSKYLLISEYLLPICMSVNVWFETFSFIFIDVHPIF